MQRTDSRDPVSWLQMIKRPIELMADHVQPGRSATTSCGATSGWTPSAASAGPSWRRSRRPAQGDRAEVADMCDRWLTAGVRDRLSRDRPEPARRARGHRPAGTAGAHRVRRRYAGSSPGCAGSGEAGCVSGRVALDTLAQDGRPEIVGGALALVLRAQTRAPGARRPLVSCRHRGPRDGRLRGVHRARRRRGAVLRRLGRPCEPSSSRAFPGLGRLGADRDGRVARPAPRLVGDVVALPYFTRPNGNLSLDVGGYVVGVPGGVRSTRTRWTARTQAGARRQVTSSAPPPRRRAPYGVWSGASGQSGRERREPVTVRAGGGVRHPAGDGPAGARHLGRLPGARPGRAARALPDRGGRRRRSCRRARGGGGRPGGASDPYATAGKGRLSTVVRTFGPDADPAAAPLTFRPSMR